MKKAGLLCLFIALCAMLALPASAAPTSGSCGDNLTWTLEDGVLTITGTGPMTEYSGQLLPEWSELRMEVTELVVGEGVTTIGGGGAFTHFENMTKVTLPSTLQSIGGSAFLWCKSLTEIVIPDSVTLIQSHAFSKCYALEEIVIPAGTEVRGDAFTESTGLKKVTIKGTGKLFMDAFLDCTGLKEIHFLGDAPVLMDPFGGVTATAYYPSGNPTWTADLLQDYGGTLTWESAAGCTHTEVADAAVPPTCTSPGLTAGKHCSACGEVLVAQQTVPKIDHKYGDWKQIKAPTTQEMGKEQRKCNTCSKTEERDVPKLQETPTEPPTQPPTEPATEPPTTPATDPEPTEEPSAPAPTQPGDGEGEMPRTDMVIILLAGLVVLAAAGGAVWLLVIRKRK